MDWADAIALELPEAVYNDVRPRIDSLRAEVERLNEEADHALNKELKLRAEVERAKAEWDASCQREQDRWHQQERLIQNERESTAEIKRLQAEVNQLNVTLTDVQVENHSLRAELDNQKCDAHHEREQAVALRAEVERLMGDNEHLRSAWDASNEYIELLKAHGQEEDEDRANDTWRRGQDQ